MQGNLQEDERRYVVEEVMVNLVELLKNPSLVRCKDLQEGGRHSEGWTGNGGSLLSYVV